MWQKVFDLAKLSCRWRYGPLLSAYLDNELSGRAAKAIGDHLGVCDHCRLELEQLRFANRALIELELIPAPGPALRASVFRIASVKEVSGIRRLYSRKIAVPLPLAAGLSLILLASIVLAITEKERPSIQSGTFSSPSSDALKVVEIPVERVVTRTIYLKRPQRVVRGSRGRDGFTITSPQSQQNITQINTMPSKWTKWSKNVLKDFRPAASANLRVVREPEK